MSDIKSIKQALKYAKGDLGAVQKMLAKAKEQYEVAEMNLRRIERMVEVSSKQVEQFQSELDSVLTNAK